MTGVWNVKIITNDGDELTVLPDGELVEEDWMGDMEGIEVPQVVQERLRRMRTGDCLCIHCLLEE